MLEKRVVRMKNAQEIPNKLRVFTANRMSFKIKKKGHHAWERMKQRRRPHHEETKEKEEENRQKCVLFYCVVTGKQVTPIEKYTYLYISTSVCARVCKCNVGWQCFAFFSFILRCRCFCWLVAVRTHSRQIWKFKLYYRIHLKIEKTAIATAVKKTKKTTTTMMTEKNCAKSVVFVCSGDRSHTRTQKWQQWHHQHFMCACVLVCVWKDIFAFVWLCTAPY